MTTKKIDHSGIVTYWNTTETSLSKLSKLLLAVDAGLEKYIPEPPTPMAALRSALETVFPGHMIRKLNREGYVVVKEDRGEKDNEFDSVASAWFDRDRMNGDPDAVPPITIDLCDATPARAIRDAFTGHRGILQPVHVGTFLARVLAEYLGGTMLRPKTGGIYWLSDDRGAKWQAISAAVEAASLKGGSAVYVLRHDMDENAVRAVRDAVVHEVTSEAERINAEIMSGELGERALQTREREAKALIAKVKRYEELLDVGLSGVRKALGDVKDAAAAAALLALADEDDEAAVAGAAR